MLSRTPAEVVNPLGSAHSRCVFLRSCNATAFAVRAFGLREIINGQLSRADSTTEYQCAITVEGNNVIILLHLNGNGSERFVAHPGNVKVTFALAIEILLAQVTMPALKQNS